MVYEGVSFNIEFIQKLSLSDFVHHKGFQHFWPKLSEEQRWKRLEELYRIAQELKNDNGR